MGTPMRRIGGSAPYTYRGSTTAEAALPELLELQRLRNDSVPSCRTIEYDGLEPRLEPVTARAAGRGRVGLSLRPPDAESGARASVSPVLAHLRLS